MVGQLEKTKRKICWQIAVINPDFLTSIFFHADIIIELSIAINIMNNQFHYAHNVSLIYNSRMWNNYYLRIVQDIRNFKVVVKPKVVYEKKHFRCIKVRVLTIKGENIRKKRSIMEVTEEEKSDKCNEEKRKGVVEGRRPRGPLARLCEIKAHFTGSFYCGLDISFVSLCLYPCYSVFQSVQLV